MECEVNLYSHGVGKVLRCENFVIDLSLHHSGHAMHEHAVGLVVNHARMGRG